MSDETPLETLPAGAVFGKYTIVRVIGIGGMGAVYEAIHSHLKKRVALKVIHRAMAMHVEVVQRFMREGSTASKVRHPHIVDVSDFGVHEGVPYLVMEYLQGESLASLIRREHPIAIEQVADLALPICAAIAAAHDEGVIHRDLKPDNLILTRGRGGILTPKVVDFGISKVEATGPGPSLTATGAMLGTPTYMSPEQMRTSKYVDARSDQYALGVILYEAFTGQVPFASRNLYELMNQVASGATHWPRTLRPDLPEALEQAVMRAMSGAAEMRFPDVRALGRAILPFASRRAQLAWQGELSAVGGAGGGAEADVPTEIAPGTTPSTLANNGREITASRSTQMRAAPRGTWIAVGVVCASVAGFSTWRLVRAPHHPVTATRTVVTAVPTTFAVHVLATPTGAAFTLDGRSAGSGVLDVTLPRNGSPHLVRVEAPGFDALDLAFTDTPPPPTVQLTPIAVQPPLPTPAPGTPTVPAVPSNAPHARHGSLGTGRNHAPIVY